MRAGSRLPFLVRYTFASQHTKEKLKEHLHLSSLEEVDQYLDNHLYLTSILDDVFLLSEDHVLLERAERMGFVQIDGRKELCTDRWGVEVLDMYSDGFCIRFSPFKVRRLK